MHLYLCTYTHTSHVSHHVFRLSVFIGVTWLIDACDMTHSYVWHVSLICVTRFINVWHTSQATNHSELQFHTSNSMRATWPIDACDMTHWYVWHDSLMCDMPHRREIAASYNDEHIFLHTCVMTHWCMTQWCVWHDSFELQWWAHIQLYACDMSHWCAWHDSLIRATWLIHVWHNSQTRNRGELQFHTSNSMRATWLIDSCDMTHRHEIVASYNFTLLTLCLRHDSLMRVTWLTGTKSWRATISHI